MAADSSRSRESTTRVSRVPHWGQRIGPPAQATTSSSGVRSRIPLHTVSFDAPRGVRPSPAAVVGLVVDDVRGTRATGPVRPAASARSSRSAGRTRDLGRQARRRLPRVAQVEGAALERRLGLELAAPAVARAARPARARPGRRARTARSSSTVNAPASRDRPRGTFAAPAPSAAIARSASWTPGQRLAERRRGSPLRRRISSSWVTNGSATVAEPAGRARSTSFW